MNTVSTGPGTFTVLVGPGTVRIIVLVGPGITLGDGLMIIVLVGPGTGTRVGTTITVWCGVGSGAGGVGTGTDVGTGTTIADGSGEGRGSGTTISACDTATPNGNRIAVSNPATATRVHISSFYTTRRPVSRHVPCHVPVAYKQIGYSLCYLFLPRSSDAPFHTALAFYLSYVPRRAGVRNTTRRETP